MEIRKRLQYWTHIKKCRVQSKLPWKEYMYSLRSTSGNPRWRIQWWWSCSGMRPHFTSLDAWMCTVWAHGELRIHVHLWKCCSSSKFYLCIIAERGYGSFYLYKKKHWQELFTWICCDDGNFCSHEQNSNNMAKLYPITLMMYTTF